MFNFANLMKNLVQKKIADKVGDLKDGAEMGKSLLDDPSQIGGMMMDKIKDHPFVAAGTMTPEEYEEYMRNRILGQSPVPGMVPGMTPGISPGMPGQMPGQMPGMPGQMPQQMPYGSLQPPAPNYLNSAQQAIGGPYG